MKSYNALVQIGREATNHFFGTARVVSPRLPLPVWCGNSIQACFASRSASGLCMLQDRISNGDRWSGPCITFERDKLVIFSIRPRAEMVVDGRSWRDHGIPCRCRRYTGFCKGWYWPFFRRWRSWRASRQCTRIDRWRRGRARIGRRMSAVDIPIGVVGRWAPEECRG